MIKGKTYEELYGKEKSDKMKQMRSITMANFNRNNKGKSWEELYGKEKSDKMKFGVGELSRKRWLDENYRINTIEKMIGKSKNLTKEQRIKLANRCSKISKIFLFGKTWEQIMGEERAKSLRNKRKNDKLTKEQISHLRIINTGKRHTKKTIIKMSLIRKGKTWEQIMGEEKCILARKRLSEKKKGKRNPMYKDGKSKIPYPIDWCPSMKRDILSRDKKCVYCGISNENHRIIFNRKLCVHHIDGNKFNLDPFNLICLCNFHHGKIQSFQEDLQDYFHAKILLLL